MDENRKNTYPHCQWSQPLDRACRRQAASNKEGGRRRGGYEGRGSWDGKRVEIVSGTGRDRLEDRAGAGYVTGRDSEVSGGIGASGKGNGPGACPWWEGSRGRERRQ